MNKKNNEIEKTTIDETAEEIKNEENKETKVYGIVCGCDKLRLRVIPNLDGSIIAELPKHTRVIIDEDSSDDEWAYVETEFGDFGYCMKNYIESPMTATVIHDTQPSSRTGEFLTSELIYYIMMTFNVPMECQKWHINRLFTLIKIFEIKNRKPRKKSKSEIMKENAVRNAKRREKYNSKG